MIYFGIIQIYIYIHTCNSKQCFCFSEIWFFSANFSFTRFSRDRVFQSSINSSQRAFNWNHKTLTLKSFLTCCRVFFYLTSWDTISYHFCMWFIVFLLTSCKLRFLSSLFSCSSCLLCSFSWRLWAEISFWAWMRSLYVRALTPSCKIEKIKYVEYSCPVEENHKITH